MAGRSADLTPYVPRLLLSWADRFGDSKHEVIEGTLAFADVSGFTKLSERLAKKGGKAGAEQMTDVVNSLFGELLTVSARRGGEMVKYGGDAVLLFFRGDDHAPRAAAACVEMQRRLAEIGRVDTGAGVVRMRMSVGVHTGDFDVFVIGRSHRELVIAGPAASMTDAMEAAAEAGEVLVSEATAALLPARVLNGERAGGRLLRRQVPDAPDIPPVVRGADPAAAPFVPVSLRAHLEAGAVEPEHRIVTLAFVHVLGLDSVLATEGRAAAAERLDATVALVQDTCDDLGVSFLASDIAPDGTKLILAAGAPLATEHPEQRIAQALRRIIDAEPPLRVRARVHRGHVFVGDVGPPFRRTFTTIGDVTNTAARVMGRAAPGEVLALEAVVDRLDGSFEADELEPFVAKGKAEPLRPFRIGPPIVTTDDGDGANASTARSLPIVGRDRELEALRRAVASAIDGEGTLVEIVGDVGLGKTRLVDEVTALTGIARRTARCEPYEQATPFFAFRHLLAAVLGIGGRGEAAAASLHDCISQLAPDLLPWVPLLADVLDLVVPDTPETAALDARFRRERAKPVVEHAFAAALAAPTMLVFEDVHWLDEPSADMLRHFERVVAGYPWLVVVTRRDEPSAFAVDESSPAPASSLVRLAPLEDAAATALVHAATATSPLRPDEVANVVARGAGNPLFVGELVAAAAATGVDHLPDSVEAVFAAQIDALPANARKVLRHAAVLGSSFDLPLLASLLGEEVDVPLRDAHALARRLRGMLIAEGRTRARFSHQLLRDVAYEALPYRSRRRLHESAGDSLERMLGDDAKTSDRAGVLSLHFFHAQRWQKCWRYATAAGTRARDKYADVEAVALYERALAVARHVDVPAEDVSDIWEKAGDSHQVLGALAKATAAYNKARSLRMDDPRGYARLCRKQAAIAHFEGRHVSMSRWIGRGLRVLVDDEAHATERGALLVFHAWAANAAGQPQKAMRLSKLALAAAEQAGDEHTVASSWVVLERAYVALDLDHDRSFVERALEIYERDDQKLMDAATLLNNLGAAAYTEGRLPEAASLYDRARERLVRAGSVVNAGVTSLNLAEVLLDRGCVDEAEAALEGLDALFRSTSYAIGVAAVAAVRGRVLLRNGDLAEAERLLADAKHAFERFDIVSMALASEADLADCYLRAGRVGDAERSVAAIAAGGGSVATVERLRACVHAQRGDRDAAAAAAATAVDAARAAGGLELALAIDVLADIRGCLDDTLAAERYKILDDLGVIATPPPPLQAAAAT